MSTTTELLAELKSKLASGELSREQVQSILAGSTKSQEKIEEIGNLSQMNNLKTPANMEKTEVKGRFRFDFSKVFAIIGAFIIFLGYSFLLGQLWPDLHGFWRTFLTLGIGMLTYVLGNLIILGLKESFIGQSVHLIAALLLPFGTTVLLDQFPSSNVNLNLVLAGIFGFYAVLYVLTDLWLNKGFFFFLKTTFYSLSVVCLIVWLSEILGSQLFLGLFRPWIVSELCLMVLGISLAIIGRLGISVNKLISGNLVYVVGFLVALGSLLAIVVDLSWLEIPYAFVLSLGIFLSAKYNSLVSLILSAIFLAGYLSYLTGKYFANTLGWPIALMLGGLIIMGVSLLTYRLSQKSTNQLKKQS